MNETEPHGTTPEVGGTAAWVRVETTIRRADGTIREHLIEEGPSGRYATVVNKALEMIPKLIVGISTAAFDQMANGTGSTAEGNAQTALVVENTTGGMARKVADVDYEADYKCTWEATWTASGARSVREIGIFDGVFPGNMMIRHVYASTKSLADAEAITCRLRYTQGRAA